MNQIFTPTVLRQDRDGQWFLMNRQAGGWREYAWGPYFALDDVRAEWAVDIGGAGEDAFGTFRRVTPAVDRTHVADQALAAEAGGAS